MNVSKWRLAMALPVGVVGLMFAGNALAAPTSTQSSTSSTRATWQGWCGGPATSGLKMLRNLKKYGIRPQLEAYYKISKDNESLETRFADFQVATLARSMVQTDNRGCNPGVLFDSKNRRKAAGDKMIVRGRDLRAAFPNGYSLTAKSGWDRKMVALSTQGQADCSNPGKGKGRFWVWVPPKNVETPPVTGPAGPRGPKGDTGPQGPPGPAGKDAKPVGKPTPKKSTKIFGSKVAKVDGVAKTGLQFYLQISQGGKRYPVVPVTSGAAKKLLAIVLRGKPFRACEVNVEQSMKDWSFPYRCKTFVPTGAKYTLKPFLNTKTTPPAPAPKPAPAAPTPTAACITTAGVPMYLPLPGGISVVNGVCTTVQVTTTTKQDCEAGLTKTGTDSSGNAICLNISNTNTNTNTATTGPVTVVVNPVVTTPVPTPTPAPPANRPPLVQILNAPQHVFVSGQKQICAQISDPDGDAVIVAIKSDSGWTRGTTSAPTQVDSQKWCTTYTAPATTGDDIVTFRVSDGKAPVVEVSTPRFPIVAGSGSNF